MNGRSSAHHEGIVAISGATGFLGSTLCRHLASSGYRVRGLARNPSSPPPGLERVEWYACSLPDQVDERAFAGGLQTFIHCAFETRFTDASRARAVNVEGSRRLFQVCRDQGVKQIVFASSLSAHDDAVSLYGRTKLDVEALLDPQRDAAIRFGHILGEGGVFWRTAGSIARMPFIPMFFGGRQEIQTVALADACEAVRLTLEKGLTGTLQFAEAEPVPLREFYGAVARAVGKVPRFLHLPGGPILLCLRVAERLGLELPISSENLLGLKRLRAFDVARDLERVGLQPRPMGESLSQIRWEQLSRS